MQQAVRFVLCETSHPGNIGAAARAMKTMGFSELWLVDPLDFPSPEADARASGAVDVLATARVVSTLAEAVADCGLVVGSSARRRKSRWPELDPRECAAAVVAAAVTRPVAVVFGAEKAGLTNTQLDLCNAQVYIPANPAYSSLNLAAAVQLIAWEIRYAGGCVAPTQTPEWPLASTADIERFYVHLTQVLDVSGFLKPANAVTMERKLRRIFNRVHLDEHELAILRGILTSLEPLAKLPASPSLYGDDASG